MSIVWGRRVQGPGRMSNVTRRQFPARLRVRCEGQRQPTRKFRQGPDVSIPRVPPPPPPVPPPPPEEEPEKKLFGFNRRTVLPFLVGVPLALVWRSYLKTEVVQEQVVASVYVPKKTKDGNVREIKKDVRLVKGRNGMVYVAGRDDKGRTYMVDRNGVLFYDSGIRGIGWYAVEPDGEVTNFYSEDGEVKTKRLGNIASLKSVKVDEFMGIPTKAKRLTAFYDTNVKPLPPNVPLVRSHRDNSLMPPFFIDEGEITLEEKNNWTPFGKKSGGGGKFRLETD